MSTSVAAGGVTRCQRFDDTSSPMFTDEVGAVAGIFECPEVLWDGGSETMPVFRVES